MKKIPISEKNLYYSVINEVIDPDIGIGVADMGLIYEAVETNGTINVKMTLTSMGCPAGPQLIASVKEVLKKKSAVKKAEVELVWDPPWTPEFMKKELKEMIFGA